MQSETRKQRLARTATKQHGRVAAFQLRALNIDRSQTGKWVDQGYLIPVLPQVYALGHTAPDPQSDLWAAVLYAGPKAMLSHHSAAHAMALIRYPLATVEVSTPRQKRSLAGQVTVYSRRQRTRLERDSLPPVTGPFDTLLDLASNSPEILVKHALAQLDYRRELDLDAIRTACATEHRHRPGARQLLNATNRHLPQLAYTKNDLEDRFIELCQAWDLPLPKCNFTVHGIEVDAYWHEAGLVVEVDGGGNHSTDAQKRVDRSKELKLRSHGLQVVRYAWDQLQGDAESVHVDLISQLAGRRAA